MRKLLTSVSAVAIAGVAAFGIVKAANLPLLSGIGAVDPATEQAIINSLIQAINSGVTGNYAFQPGPVGNALGNPTTASQTLGSAVIPTGTLVAAGQGARVRCSGIKSNAITSANLGITVGRSMNVSLEGVVGANSAWDVELQLHAATNPVTANYTWVGRGLASSPSGSATNFMSVNSGNDTTVTDNNANFQLPVTCVVYAVAGGVATGTVTMENFIVEQLR